MLRSEELAAATEALFGAALVGEGWDEALTALSGAAGARGVAVIRNRRRRLVGAMFNREIASPIEDYMAGRAPPSSRQVQVSHDGRDGFRVDGDDYTAEQLARDPFYQDFLRPIGMFWHANARLDYEDGDEVAISFKRELARGPYERRDAEALDRVLPAVKAALRVAHRVRDAEAAGLAQALGRRGDPVFELDAWGRVLRVHGPEPDGAGPLAVRRGRLSTRSPRAQSTLDGAVSLALSRRVAKLAPLGGPHDSRAFLQVVPVAGAARDVFGSAAAVAVLIDGREPVPDGSPAREAVQDLFSLSDRQWRVARGLIAGATPEEIAADLGIEVRTVRFHLRRLFEKTGTSRQAQLVGLLGRLAS